jgi:hypothetical protein
MAAVRVRNEYRRQMSTGGTPRYRTSAARYACTARESGRHFRPPVKLNLASRSSMSAAFLALRSSLSTGRGNSAVRSRGTGLGRASISADCTASGIPSGTVSGAIRELLGRLLVGLHRGLILGRCHRLRAVVRVRCRDLHAEPVEQFGHLVREAGELLVVLQQRLVVPVPAPFVDPQDDAGGERDDHDHDDGDVGLGAGGCGGGGHRIASACESSNTSTARSPRHHAETAQESRASASLRRPCRAPSSLRRLRSAGRRYPRVIAHRVTSATSAGMSTVTGVGVTVTLTSSSPGSSRCCWWSLLRCPSGERSAWSRSSWLRRRLGFGHGGFGRGCEEWRRSR